MLARIKKVKKRHTILNHYVRKGFATDAAGELLAFLQERNIRPGGSRGSIPHLCRCEQLDSPSGNEGGMRTRCLGDQEYLPITSSLGLRDLYVLQLIFVYKGDRPGWRQSRTRNPTYPHLSLRHLVAKYADFPSTRKHAPNSYSSSNIKSTLPFVLSLGRQPGIAAPNRGI